MFLIMLLVDILFIWLSPLANATSNVIVTAIAWSIISYAFGILQGRRSYL